MIDFTKIGLLVIKPSTKLDALRIYSVMIRLKETIFPRRDLTKERKTVERLLNAEGYKCHWNKYQKAKRKPKHWYSLCSDAQNLRGLAKLTGREAEYILLYRMLSEAAHASDVVSGLLRRNGMDGIEVHQLRGPLEKAKEVTSLSANYLVWCHDKILKTYRKDHDVQNWFVRWYVDDYRPFFMWAITPGPFMSPLSPCS
jgi:hypothetical protein